MIPTPERNYDYARDGYEKQQGQEKHSEVLYERRSPSELEKDSSTRRRVKMREKGKADREEASKTLSRPAGNIMGNILHRTMELLIGRFERTVSKEKMHRIAHICMMQAVSENKNDISESKQIDAYRQFAEMAAFCYYKWLVENQIMDGVKAVHTEIPFSYLVQENSRNIWVNGTADLILEYEDGRVRLLDYKSDDDFLVDEESMEQSFAEIYKLQLDEYKKMIVRMFHTPMEQIETAILSFSQKDKEGKQLSEKELRVRYTVIQ
ncbi:MAG: PD-(D/E)XK nuclease family protein [Clostridiales bacterium]|nr:PD-(D/E)XK nuclease family protein [Clostridiales bacterium]